MTEETLQKVISGGESSTVQFKERLPHIESIAHELIAFSNSHGGVIIFGINDKTGEVNGLSFEEIRIVNQQTVNAASQKMYPPVRLLVFDNRIEIISPGKLPNSLTVEDVKFGNPVIRNNQIAMFASRTLPYSGLGSGLRRSLQEQPDMELVNDIDGEQFIVRFPRKT